MMAAPFHSIGWRPCEMWPESSNAIAVTKPISARRRVSDLAEFVYKRANLAGMAPGLRYPEIVSSTSCRRIKRPLPLKRDAKIVCQPLQPSSAPEQAGRAVQL